MLKPYNDKTHTAHVRRLSFSIYTSITSRASHGHYETKMNIKK